MASQSFYNQTAMMNLVIHQLDDYATFNGAYEEVVCCELFDKFLNNIKINLCRLILTSIHFFRMTKMCFNFSKLGHIDHKA